MSFEKKSLVNSGKSSKKPAQPGIRRDANLNRGNVTSLRRISAKTKAVSKFLDKASPN